MSIKKGVITIALLAGFLVPGVGEAAIATFSEGDPCDRGPENFLSSWAMNCRKEQKELEEERAKEEAKLEIVREKERKEEEARLAAEAEIEAQQEAERLEQERLAEEARIESVMETRLGAVQEKTDEEIALLIEQINSLMAIVLMLQEQLASMNR